MQLIPTLEKMEKFCSLLEIHPVSLVAACYLRKEGRSSIHSFLEEIEAELVLLSVDFQAQPEQPVGKSSSERA